MGQKILLALLKGMALLPLRVLYVFSDFIYFIVYHIVGYRKNVVRRNLKESFPEKSPSELRIIEREYYRYMCDIIVETVKLLHISDAELKRRVEVVNPELVNEATLQGHSSVLLLGHYGNWEWVQEIKPYLVPTAFMASIYRPLNSPAFDAVYKRLRSRWGAEIIPQKNAVKKLLTKANQPWVCGFIADARPRHGEADAVIPFLNHYTSFIYGPEVLGTKVGAEFFFLKMERTSRGHYRITFHQLEGADRSLSFPYTREFWKEFEQTIKKSPACWLWSHKRWKYDRVV